MIELFEDEQHGAFFSTAAGDSSLVLRIKDDHDGAEPSGNSIAALALLRLARMTNNQNFAAGAERTLQAFGPRLRTAPVSVPQMLVAFQFSRSKPKQVIISGERNAAGTREMIRLLHQQFAPNRVALLVDSPETKSKLGEWLPMVRDMHATNGQATAYVCENFTCQLPTPDVEQFAELLK